MGNVNVQKDLKRQGIDEKGRKVKGIPIPSYSLVGIGDEGCRGKEFLRKERRCERKKNKERKNRGGRM